MQVVFYQGDFMQQMEAVERGEVDVGFMLSGWLEANFPKSISKFNLIDLKNLTYQTKLYPFLMSTQLVPAYGLAAGPEVPWILQEQPDPSRSSSPSPPSPPPIPPPARPASRASPLPRRTRSRARSQSTSASSTPTPRARCTASFQRPIEFIRCQRGYMLER
jgi:hypothetical protein